MLKDINAVENWLRANGLEHWDVKTKDGENSFIFRTADDEPLETRFNRFRNVMALSTGNRFLIIGKKGRNDAKGNFYEEFSNSDHNNQYSAIGSVGSTIPDGYISRNEVENILAKERLALKMERLEKELSEMKEKNKQLEQPINEFLRQLAPFATPVISGLVGKFIPGAIPPGLGALTTDQHTHTLLDNDNMQEQQGLSTAEQNRLENALTTWSNADNDWLPLLEKVAQLAASGDNTYNMAKQMLLNM
jgi:hypothetical protein